jgi:hypothetical protein
MNAPTAWGRLGPSLVLAVGALLYLVWTGRYDNESGSVPRLVAWLAVALTLLDVAASSDTALGRLLTRLLSGSAEAGGDERHAAPRTWLRELSAVAWIAGFIGLLALVGFLPALPVYITLYMVLQGGRPLLASIISALVTTALIYVVFELLWNFTVFRGFLFE